MDTTGAGDVFTAGVTDALLAGHTIDQALLAGTVWASYAVASATSIPPLALKDYLAVSGNATFEVIPCQE
ncbi:MAG: PfkB family carbohydrate kinase [Candidatus Competibacterales bacterium]